MGFRTDRERRAAFRKMKGMVPATRPRVPARLPSGTMRGLGNHGPLSSQYTARATRFEEPLEWYILEGQRVAEDTKWLAQRLEEPTDLLLGTYQEVLAYELDRLAAHDAKAVREARAARRAIEGEFSERSTLPEVLRDLRRAIRDHALEEAMERYNGGPGRDEGDGEDDSP